MKIRIVIGLVLVALAAVVALQNSAPVEMRFLFWKATVDRIILLPGIFIAGALSGILITVGRSMRNKQG